MEKSEVVATQSVSTRLLLIILLMIVALAPIPFGSNRPWSWSLLSLCIAGLLLAWAAVAIFDSSAHQLPWGRYRPLMILFGFFIFWSLFQTIGPAPRSWWAPAWGNLENTLQEPITGVISATPEKSMTSIMLIITYASIFWLSVHLCRRTKSAKLALWSVTVSAIAYSIYGLIVQFSGGGFVLWFSKWGYGGVMTSTFINRNHFAVYVGIALLCTLALIADQVRQTTESSVTSRSGFIQLLDNISFEIVLLCIAFMILASALLLTQSRGGVFMTVISILVFLWVLATTSNFAAKSVIRFGVIILLAGAVFGLISGNLLASRIVGVAESLTDRLTVFRTTLEAICDRPLLGFGLGSFSSVFPAYRGGQFKPNDPAYDYAHNVYLELTLESGLLGTFLVMLVMILILCVCIWGAKQRRRNGFFSAVGVALTVLVFGDGLFDFALQIPAIAAVYCLLLGTAYSQSWPTGIIERRVTPSA